MELVKLIGLVVFVQLVRAQMECKPGQTVQRLCQRCDCSDNGTVVNCTWRCGIGPVVIRCPLGSTYEVDCNTCTCNPNGIGYNCTQYICTTEGSSTTTSP